MKRKVLAIILVLVVTCVFGLAGCGSGGPGPAQKKPTMEASIDKVFTVGSYDGKKLLVVNLDVTNNSDFNLSATSVQMYATASLDGKTLASAFLSDSNPVALPWTSSIGPGAEGPAQLVFELSATEGMVDLSIAVDSIDYTDKIVILDESFDLAGVEAVVSESEFNVKVTNAIVTDDGSGKDLLVLYINFTNNSDSAMSFSYAINANLFQNDIALKRAYLPYNHPLDDSDLSSNTYTEIKKGASIDLILVYDLYDAVNPVEIQLVDMQSYDYAVILEKTIQIAGA